MIALTDSLTLVYRFDASSRKVRVDLEDLQIRDPLTPAMNNELKSLLDALVPADIENDETLGAVYGDDSRCDRATGVGIVGSG